MEDKKLIVGWREWLALPALNIPAIKAKIDTGARTSALHTMFTEQFELNGQDMIRFRVQPLHGRVPMEIECVAPLVDERVVTNSGGQGELRYVIETTLSCRGVTWSAEMTLTNREDMKFPMLLGRTALAGRFLVDPEASYLGGRKLGRMYAKRQK